MCDGVTSVDIEKLLHELFGAQTKRVHYLSQEAQQTACCGAERPLWRESEAPPTSEGRFVEVRYAGFAAAKRFLILTGEGERCLKTGPP